MEGQAIGARVKMLMDAMGCNGKEMARQIGVQSSAISHILSGRNKPSFQMLHDILKAYPEVSPDWLILGVGPMLRGSLGARARPTGLFFSPASPAAEGELGAVGTPVAGGAGDAMPHVVTDVNNAITQSHPLEGIGAGERPAEDAARALHGQPSRITPTIADEPSQVPPQAASSDEPSGLAGCASGSALPRVPPHNGCGSGVALGFTDVIILREDGTFVRYRSPSE